MRKRIVTYEKQLDRNGGFTEIVLEFEKSNQRFVFMLQLGTIQVLRQQRSGWVQ